MENYNFSNLKKRINFNSQTFLSQCCSISTQYAEQNSARLAITVLDEPEFTSKLDANMLL